MLLDRWFARRDKGGPFALPTVGPIKRAGALSVVDHAVVSGTNFTTAVLVGRYGGNSQLGMYAIAFSVLIVLGLQQRALLVSAFVVLRQKLSTEEQRRMRGDMMIFALLAACTAGILAICVLRSRLSLALAMALVPGMLRDNLRRVATTDLEVEFALLANVCVAAVQISSVFYMAISGTLSATGALQCWAISSTAGCVVLLWFGRHNRVVGWPQNIGTIRQLWPVGRWVSLSQLLSSAQAFSVTWLLGAVHSLELAGLYGAGGTLLRVLAPIVEGIGSILGPMLAESAAAGNASQLRNRVYRATACLLVVSLSLVAATILLGQYALTKFFGPQFDSAHGILVLLAITSGVLNLGTPPSKALTQLGRASSNVAISSIALVVTLVLCGPLLLWLGEIGAALAMVIGAALATGGRWSVLKQLNWGNASK